MNIEKKWLNYCSNPEMVDVDEFTFIFSEIGSAEELRKLLPPSIFPAIIEERLKNIIFPAHKIQNPYQSLEAIREDIRVMREFAIGIKDKDIISAYSSENTEITESEENIIDIESSDIPSSWIIEIISDAFRGASKDLHVPVRGLFEACFGLTSDFKASWHICSPLFPCPPINLETYFELYLVKVNYAVTEDRIVAYLPKSVQI